jgi:hypothetical protein
VFGPAISKQVYRSGRSGIFFRNALPYEEAKAGVSRVIEQPLEEMGALSDWDLSFSEYIEEHKNSTLLFCWYAKYVAVVFQPGRSPRYLGFAA